MRLSQGAPFATTATSWTALSTACLLLAAKSASAIAIDVTNEGEQAGRYLRGID